MNVKEQSYITELTRYTEEISRIDTLVWVIVELFDVEFVEFIGKRASIGAISNEHRNRQAYCRWEIVYLCEMKLTIFCFYQFLIDTEQLHFLLLVQYSINWYYRTEHHANHSCPQNTALEPTRSTNTFLKHMMQTILEVLHEAKPVFKTILTTADFSKLSTLYPGIY